MNEPQPESIRQAMELAWRDHHHARDQTWKALQTEAVLAAGLVSVDAQYYNAIATAAAAFLVIALHPLRHPDIVAPSKARAPEVRFHFQLRARAGPSSGRFVSEV